MSARSRSALASLFSATAGSIVVLALSAAPAPGAQSHAFSSSFGSFGEGAGQLSLVVVTPETPASGSGVAVNDATHNLYVADTGNHRVDEFSSAGAFIRAWGWGVATGASEFQSCSATCQKGLSGSSPGEFEVPSFVVVDNSPTGEGNLYVGDTGDTLVSKFDKEGKLIGGWGNNGFGESANGQLGGKSAEPQGCVPPEAPCSPAARFGELAGLAIDPSGNLWVYVGSTAQAPNNHMYELNQAGGVTRSWEAPVQSGAYSPEGIAVDSFDDLYIVENASAVERLGSGGEFIGTVAQIPALGLVLDPSHRDLYVDEGGSTILDFSAQCEPVHSSCTPVQTFGSPQLSAAAGLAVDSATGVVYATNTAADQIAAFGVTLEARSDATSEVKATSATLNGEVNPEGSELTKCRFEYGETKSYGNSVPCAESLGEVGNGSNLTKVRASVSGLTGGITYHFRLHVTNAAGDVRSEDEELKTLTTALIEDALAAEVTATTAKLNATVNPEGLPAACTFEYGTSTSYGINVPCEPASLGSGTSGVAVSVELKELSPETTYHWRVRASDINGTVPGADNTFIAAGTAAEKCTEVEEALRLENNSSTLPDCRAYEMVTPPQKNGALIVPSFASLPHQVSEDGSRVIASSIQCFSGALSCDADRHSKGPPFEFTRSSEGWVTHPLAPPAGAFETSTVWGYSADTGMVLYSAPIPGQAPDEFSARQPDGSFSAIGPIAENLPVSSIGTRPVVATRDLSHVLYESNGPLWLFDGSKGETLYQYAGFGQAKPVMVGVSGGEGSTNLIGTCGTALGAAKDSAAFDALSSDGRTVYFTSCDAELYARVDGERPDAHTVLISGRSPSECTGPCNGSRAAAAYVESVSEDGTKALFTSTQQLTDNGSEDARVQDTAEAGRCSATTGSNGCNLYLYDFDNPSGKNLIAVSAGDSSGLGPQVQGVVAVSADGSHVYFVAKGVLAGKNATGSEPSEGADNLYVYERDAANPAGHSAFIATLPGTEVDHEPEAEQWTSRETLQANVSRDGRFLVFTSQGALTANATRRVGPGQVYRYDAQGEQLLRVSIGERGFNDNGNAGTGNARIAVIGANIGEPRRDPTMSDDGRFVFFQSPVGLTPGALDDVPVNGRGESADLAQNIYEWEAEGTGSCGQAGGCVLLISDGRDVSESGGNPATLSSVELLGADITGENVFFTTIDRLVPSDTDTQLDYYDARIEGGFPAPHRPRPCQVENGGDQCREGGSEASIFLAPPSAMFSGAGNLAPVAPGSPVKSPVKVLTQTQKLAKALKACRAKHDKHRRTLCERQASKKYGPKRKAKKGKTKAHK